MHLTSQIAEVVVLVVGVVCVRFQNQNFQNSKTVSPSPELENHLSLHMLLLEDSSAPLNVIRLQPCWSRLNRLATVFLKGTKAISAVHPHTHTLSPHVMRGWRQGFRDSGTDGAGGLREGGF